MDPILVFDGVFGPSTAAALGDYGHGVYQRHTHINTQEPGVSDTGTDRDMAKDSSLLPVEEFIESVLVAVGDTGAEVEYWGRTDWLPIESHRDTDEDAGV
jgi:hypothetical protein